MRRTTKILPLIAALGLLTLVTGCEAQNAPSPSPSETSETTDDATPSDKPSADDKETTDSKGSDSTSLTPPGTTLKVGDSAIVTNRTTTGDMSVKITVVSVDRGVPSDLDSLTFEEPIGDMVPYYVHATAEVIANPGDGSNQQLLAATADGKGTTRFNTFDHTGESFPKCAENSLGSDLEVGDNINFCNGFLVEPEETIGSVIFGETGGDYSYMDGNQVTWMN